MSGAFELKDGAARARIRQDLDATLFVEAAAGTGKTTALVSRIVAVLQAGRACLDSVVAVTFTEKAAGEMKLRLRAELERLGADPATTKEERARLLRAVAELELARIGTIHAFCADLLRERPVEARVDPRFEVLPDDEAGLVLDRVFDRWFEGVLDDPPEGVRRVLRRRPRGARAQTPRAALRAAAERLCQHRDFGAAWTRTEVAREAAIDALLERLREVGAYLERAEKPDDWLPKNLREIAHFVAENDVREAVAPRDYDGLEAGLRDLASSKAGWGWRGAPWAGFGELSREDVLRARDAVKRELDAFLLESGMHLAACLREDLRPVVLGFEEQKAQEGRLDFLDLLVRARDLVRDDATVRRELQARFSHFFVDEFQDTDPLQAEIVVLLAADDGAQSDWRAVRTVPGKLFVVGDPKQSIYRFRRADVALYEDIKRRLARQGAEVLQLSVSFRGVPGIQRTVNAAFARAMTGSDDGSQAEYVPLDAFREPPAGQPAVVALPVPRPYSDWAKIVNWRIDESLPQAVGAFVDWLCRASGWQVEDGGRRVPIEARHVCLLFRRLVSFGRDVTRPYVQAFEARGIPHVLLGGSSFHAREEVLALRNALSAIEWPDDALRVYATLRGPLFALSDDQLLAFRHAQGSLHPLRLTEQPGDVAEALALLARLHRARNQRPIGATIHELLHAVRAHAGIAIWPTGEQALANCLRLTDRARRFERGGAPSFRAFVEMLEDEAEQGLGSEAPVVEEGTDGVRIMTVHKAKGLEFQVVVLADLTCNATRPEPSQHVDVQTGLFAEPICGVVPQDLADHREVELARDQHEAVRVAYVAATRARDLLVVPAVGDGPQDGWLSVLNPAVYPAADGWRQAQGAEGCPAFGDDSVLDRPEKAKQKHGVRPGGHVAEAGSEIVWWDPGVLGLDVEAAAGLRQDKLLRADESGALVEEGVRAHEAWRARRDTALAAAAAPSVSVRTVTARAAELAGGETRAGTRADVEVLETTADRTRRPAGPRFGTLVHAVLAHVPLDAGRDAIAELARAQAALLASPPEEVDAAVDAVAQALVHPLMRRAAASESVRRECPVLLREGPDGPITEGVLDLAFSENEHEPDSEPCWTVVDFKTDRELGGALAPYRAQVRLYAEAVARATGARAVGVLLVV